MKSCFAIILALSGLALPTSVSALPPSTANYANGTLDISSPTGKYQPQRRTISPYIAMAQNVGNLSFVNYFTITRPLIAQQQTNRVQAFQLEQIQRQVQAEAQGIDPATGQPTIRSTGHRTSFMTQGRYFGSLNPTKRAPNSPRR